MKLVPFRVEMIRDAGTLLAERHKRNRQSLPLLPRRFEDPQIAAQAVTSLWQEKFKDGYAAFGNGRMVAYLLGVYSVQPWGRCGYVYLPGYALAGGEDPAVLQDLYALLGDDWVKKGCFNHYLYISSADLIILEALFDLGFGKERVDALLDFEQLEIPEVHNPAGVTIRRACSGDNLYLGSLSDLIFKALSSAPYWHPTLPEIWEDLYEGWSELADDKDWVVWLALENDQALGMAGFTAMNETDIDMLASPRTAYLSVAATKPEARGRGISTALTWLGLDQARQNGFEICYTNWISPNLLASRFWPRFGFTDVAYRVARMVNPMIAWASGKKV